MDRLVLSYTPSDDLRWPASDSGMLILISCFVVIRHRVLKMFT